METIGKCKGSKENGWFDKECQQITERKNEAYRRMDSSQEAHRGNTRKFVRKKRNSTEKRRRNTILHNFNKYNNHTQPTSAGNFIKK